MVVWRVTEAHFIGRRGGSLWLEEWEAGLLATWAFYKMTPPDPLRHPACLVRALSGCTVFKKKVVPRLKRLFGGCRGPFYREEGGAAWSMWEAGACHVGFLLHPLRCHGADLLPHAPYHSLSKPIP